MERPSVTLPAWMLDEIEERRVKGSNRSEYIREAIQRRFDAEDGGEWDSPENSGTDAETVAD